MTSAYTPNGPLSGAPQLLSADGKMQTSSPFAPGTVFNQGGVVYSPTSKAVTPVLSNIFPPPAATTSSSAVSTVPISSASSTVSAAPVPVSLPPSRMPSTVSTAPASVVRPSSSALSSDTGSEVLTASSPRPRSPRSSSRFPQRSRSPSPKRSTMVGASTSEGLDARASDLAGKLLSRGVIMLDQIVVRDHNGQVAEQFIKGVTTFGDKVLILLDQDQLPAPNVEGTLVGSSTMIPYSLKTGVHQCSKSELCGVAFDCQGEICTLIRKNGSLEPREITFTIAGEGRLQLPMGVIASNDAVNAYPVVLWSEFWGINGISGSELRAHKLRMLNYIDIVSQRINAHISRSVDGLLEKTVDAAQLLHDKLAQIDREVFHSDGQGGQGLRDDLDGAVKKLRSFSEGYHKLDTVPSEYESNFKMTEANLFHRKEYQRQLNSLLNVAAGYNDVINSISDQLDAVIVQIAQIKALNQSKLRE